MELNPIQQKIEEFKRTYSIALRNITEQFNQCISELEKIAKTNSSNQSTAQISASSNKISYTWERYDNYAIGVDALRNSGEKPLNFKQNLEARMKDTTLFDTYQDSRTAIHYRGDNMFKIIMDSPHLLNIPKKFNDICMIVDYDKTKGVELDMNKSKYNQNLTKEQFLAHEAWYVSFGGKLHEDKHRDAKVVKRMEKYAEEFYDKQRHKTGMGYYLRSNPNAGELRSLVLGSGDKGSNARLRNSLDYITRFVRRSPK